MLVAPLDVRRRDRRPVMELRARAQPERGALRVLGELEAFGERRMIVELVAEILDQAVVHRHQEVVGAGGAVVLLRIEPARRDVGVPGQRQLALRHHGCRAVPATRCPPAPPRRPPERRACPARSGCLCAGSGLGRSVALLPPMAAQSLRPRHCLLRRCDVPDDGVQPRRDWPRDLLMHALSLFDRREVRSFVFVQDQATLGGAFRKPARGPATECGDDTAGISRGQATQMVTMRENEPAGREFAL